MKKQELLPFHKSVEKIRTLVIVSAGSLIACSNSGQSNLVQQAIARPYHLPDAPLDNSVEMYKRDGLGQGVCSKPDSTYFVNMLALDLKALGADHPVDLAKNAQTSLTSAQIDSWVARKRRTLGCNEELAKKYATQKPTDR